jgi:hypothetical protein
MEENNPGLALGEEEPVNENWSGGNKRKGLHRHSDEVLRSMFHWLQRDANLVLCCTVFQVLYFVV